MRNRYVARKALTYITVFFLYFSFLLLTIALIRLVSGEINTTTTYFFMGVIICLLFANIAKPTSRSLR